MFEVKVTSYDTDSLKATYTTCLLLRVSTHLFIIFPYKKALQNPTRRVAVLRESKTNKDAGTILCFVLFKDALEIVV